MKEDFDKCRVAKSRQHFAIFRQIVPLFEEFCRGYE